MSDSSFDTFKGSFISQQQYMNRTCRTLSSPELFTLFAHLQGPCLCRCDICSVSIYVAGHLVTLTWEANAKCQNCQRNL